MQVVLERIRNESISDPHPAFPLVLEPAVRTQRPVHETIERVVVRELHVTADIPRESLGIDPRRGQAPENWGRFQEVPILAFFLKAASGTQSRRSGPQDKKFGLLCAHIDCGKRGLLLVRRTDGRAGFLREA